MTVFSRIIHKFNLKCKIDILYFYKNKNKFTSYKQIKTVPNTKRSKQTYLFKDERENKNE